MWSVSKAREEQWQKSFDHDLRPWPISDQLLGPHCSLSSGFKTEDCTMPQCGSSIMFIWNWVPSHLLSKSLLLKSFILGSGLSFRFVVSYSSCPFKLLLGTMDSIFQKCPILFAPTPLIISCFISLWSSPVWIILIVSYLDPCMWLTL